MKLTADTDALKKQFAAAMLRMGAASGLTVRDTVRQGAVMFARSAARATPPDAGRSIPASRFKREIRVSPVVLNNGTVIHLDPKKYLSGSRPIRGASAEYKIAVKVPRTRRMRVLIFASLAEAKRRQKIATRGLMRAGWWASLGNLGQTAAEKYGEAVAAMLDRIHAYIETATPEEASVEMINRVDEGHGSEEAKRIGMRVGLARASNAMNAVANKRMRDAVSSAGGAS